MESASSISYNVGKLKPSYAVFAYVGDFSLRMRSFDHITTSVIFEFSAPVFL